MKITENTTLNELFNENKGIRNFLVELSQEFKILAIDDIIDLVGNRVTIDDLSTKGNFTNEELIEKIENFIKK